MPSSRSVRRDSTRSSERTDLTNARSNQNSELEGRPKRTVASLYDAVAGRIGLNGFLTREQVRPAGVSSISPEEALFRRVDAPDNISQDFYNADERLANPRILPDSELLKAIHKYASDFYVVTSDERGSKDFRSFDGTALLALGVLLEEASKDSLGETGDMALTEPDGLENALPESKMTKYQIIGKVKPRSLKQPELQLEESDHSAEEERPRKRRRAKFRIMSP